MPRYRNENMSKSKRNKFISQTISFDEQNFIEELEDYPSFGSVSEYKQLFVTYSNISTNRTSLYEFIRDEFQNESRNIPNQTKSQRFCIKTKDKDKSELYEHKASKQSPLSPNGKCDGRVNNSKCNRDVSQPNSGCPIITTKEDRNKSYDILKKLVNKGFSNYPNVAFSYMGPDLRGSTSISSDKHHLSLLLLWSVPWLTSSSISPPFHAQAVPFINRCKNLSDKDMIEISRDTTKEIRTLIKQMMEVSATSPVEFFLNLTDVICSLREDIGLLLESFLSSYNNDNRSKKMSIINSELKHHNSPSMRTLDIYDFQSDAERVEIESINRESVRRRQDDPSPLLQEVCISSLSNSDTCFICFEKFGGDELIDLRCSHKTCKSCWRRLIKSSVSSGNTKIRCPAYKCSNQITIYDVAHNLFNDRHDDCDEELSKLLMKASRFHIEQYCNDNNQLDVKHCCTPSCSRICSFTSQILDNDNIKSYFCDCGAMYCTKCKKIAHFGISCEEYGRVRKELDNGRFNAEMRSLDWVRTHTRPCPKCKFPINKIDGCNHVQCSKCMYYFCWQCGGPGGKCRSFFCDKTRRSHLKDPTIPDDFVSEIPAKIQALANLTSVEAAVELSRSRDGEKTFIHNKGKGGLSDSQISFNSLQCQLLQTLAWLHLKIFSCILNENTSIFNNSKISSSIDELELILDGLYIRNEKMKFTKKQIIDTSNNVYNYDMKIQHVDEWFRNEVYLEPLCAMTNKSFYKKVKLAIAKAISILFQGKQCQRSKKKIYCYENKAPLNEKCKNSMKSRYRRVYTGNSFRGSSDDTCNESETSNEDESTKIRWKGKSKAKAIKSYQRSIAL